jgi:hypothetical protein
LNWNCGLRVGRVVLLCPAAHVVPGTNQALAPINHVFSDPAYGGSDHSIRSHHSRSPRTFAVVYLRRAANYAPHRLRLQRDGVHISELFGCNGAGLYERE